MNNLSIFTALKIFCFLSNAAKILIEKNIKNQARFFAFLEHQKSAWQNEHSGTN
jgi:hypothetical protein